VAWTAPRTWVVGEVVTAAQMNAHVRDNLVYLKGGAGAITIDSGVTVTGSVTASGAVTGTNIRHHERGSVGVTAGSTSNDSVSFATAYGAAPVVVANILGTSAQPGYAAPVSVSTTGATIGHTDFQTPGTGTLSWLAAGA